MAARRSVIFFMMWAAVMACLLSLIACGGKQTAAAAAPKTEKVVIKGETFNLELAADPKSREQGLMNRSSIKEDGGMLFVFPDSQVRVQSFWMGYCLVDMDIIFLDRQGRVTAVHRMKSQPPRREDETDDEYRARIPHYSSGYPAQFAIELKAGSLDRLKVKFEDRIELDLPRLKRLAR